MKIRVVKNVQATNIRTRLTLWYVCILAIVLALFSVIVFIFQYALLERQMYHDEVQDVETVEGLLFFDQTGRLQLQQNYYSRPQSHLLIDRLMEVHDLSGAVLYRSETLHGMSLGGPAWPGEGDGSFNERTEKLSDGTKVFFVSHIHSMQGRTLIIRLGYGLSAFYDRMRQFLMLLLVALPVALLAAGFAGFEIAKKALRPLQQMADKAEQITASNLHDRLEVENEDDELGQMARVFNQLLQRLDEAFEQLKKFTADAAHELRTPLSSLRTVGEVALQQAHKPEDYREAIGSILEETARLNQTIEGLLILAKAEASHPGQKDTEFFLSELVDEILALLGILIEERNLTVLEDRKSDHLPVRADRSLVRIALMNVLHNAVKFSPISSTLRVDYTIGREPESMAEVSVQDEGPGLTPGEYQRVFDRFFTGSRDATALNSSSGLGLSIARLAIQRSGGVITFDEKSQRGARCIIRMPAANE